jgi:hypothetical protein
MVLPCQIDFLRHTGVPNGVAIIAKNQMTGPPTVSALSSMTPDGSAPSVQVSYALDLQKYAHAGGANASHYNPALTGGVHSTMG